MRSQFVLTTLSLLPFTLSSASATASRPVLPREPKIKLAARGSVRITSVEAPHIYALPISSVTQTGRMLLRGRQAGTCDIGFFACSEFEGCCPTGTDCFSAGGENGCCPILETCTSVGGCEVGYFECPETISAGCCKIGTSCTVDGCASDGGSDDSDSGTDDGSGGEDDSSDDVDDDAGSEQCPVGRFACLESEGGGCCLNGYICATDGSGCTPEEFAEEDGGDAGSDIGDGTGSSDDDAEGDDEATTTDDSSITSTPTDTGASETGFESDTETDTETETERPTRTRTSGGSFSTEDSGDSGAGKVSMMFGGGAAAWGIAAGAAAVLL